MMLQKVYYFCAQPIVMKGKRKQMGMASSQARLLHLTGRMHQLEYKAQKLEAQKLQLANESNRVYEDYENALDAAKIQYRTINSDGSTTFVDASLNALENGAVPSYTGATSNETFLLYDGANNTVLITNEFANEYNIQSGVAPDPGTLEDYLTVNHCPTEPVTELQDDPTSIKDVHPVENEITRAVGSSNVTTYTASAGALTAPSTTDTTSTTVYNLNGVLTAPVDRSTSISETVITTGSTPADSVSSHTDVTVDKSYLNIEPSTITYKPFNQEVLVPSSRITASAHGLNSTMQELFPTMDFGDSNTDYRQGSTSFTDKGNTLHLSFSDVASNSTNNYFQSDAKYYSMQYNASTTINDIFNWVQSTTGGKIQYDASSGKLISNDGTFSFWSTDDGYNDNILEKELNDINKSWGSDVQLTKDTKMIDYLYSNKSASTDYSFNQDSLYIDGSEGLVRTTYDGSIPKNQVTLDQYLQYLDSQGIIKYSTDASGKMIIEKSGDYNIYFLNLNGYQSKDKTSTTTIDLKRKAIAENIYLAQAIVNGTAEDDYNNNKTSGVDAIFNQLKSNYTTNEEKCVLATFAEELQDAIKNNDTTKMNTLISQYNSNSYTANNYTIGMSSSIRGMTYYSVAFNIDDNDVATVANTTTRPGGTNKKVDSASVDDILLALAQGMYDADNSLGDPNAIREDLRTRFSGYGYTDEDIVSISNHLNNSSEKTDIINKLRANQRIDSYTSDFDGYTINQAASALTSTAAVSGTESHYVECDSLNDIATRLAADINASDNTVNLNDVVSQIKSTFSDAELASMSYYYGTSDWNNIVSGLQSGISKANVNSSYLNKYSSYSDIRPDSRNDITITENPTGSSSPVKGEMNIPTIDGIASNLSIAFKKLGHDVDAADVTSKLQALYNADTQDNNANLANINYAVTTYLNGNSGLQSQVENVYNHLYSGQALNVTEMYKKTDYQINRANLGTATVSYNQIEVDTGRTKWKTSDPKYNELVEKWQKAKGLVGYNFQIVDAQYCGKSEYVSNWLTQSGASLLRFGGKNEDGSLNLKGTNVSVETSLREVADEKDLKKAEAKYEADMKRIDNKDKKYDTDLAALETERNATKEEMETLKTVAKDNVDRTFKLFS